MFADKKKQHTIVVIVGQATDGVIITQSALAITERATIFSLQFVYLAD